MGILLKIIIILGLICIIGSMFTKSKAERVARRDRVTNILLVILIVMLGIFTAVGLMTR